jgi:hypothetical protein
MTLLGAFTLFIIFTAATFLGVLGSQLVARYIGEKQMARRQKEAMEAFTRLMSEDCGDPNCEVHGHKEGEQPALKN